MILLFDIGNTHTHLGLANTRRMVRGTNIPTSSWFDGTGAALVRKFVGKTGLSGAALCSVVPRATPPVVRATQHLWGLKPLLLNAATITGVGIDYPKPETIG